MLPERFFIPEEKDILYHYCSSEKFHSICSNTSIRVSDIFTMNDYLEMHWGYSMWEKAASELLSENIEKDFLDKVDEVIHYSSAQCLILAACFSLDGDVLSQWRAYADDGNGYAIGFNARDLINLPIRPLKVEYNEREQIKEIKNIIKVLYHLEKKENEKYGEIFINTCTIIAFDLASYKNPAFSEEKEVRLIHLLNFKKSNNSQKLVDPGGTYFKNQIEGQEVKFTMSQDIPKAYLDFDFANNGSINPIKEVIIGPKNFVRETAISIYLETLNIGGVNIKKSKASYR